ncbi:MAG: DUF805 domain-containing protein [Chitinophagales bacterium]|nr:DUF805 domain-containing protein [Hyphomicrobiales bacterium]
MLWKWLLSFKGRIGRGRYWAANCLYLVVLLGAFGFASYVTPGNENVKNPWSISAFIIAGVFIFLSSAAVCVKRFHDRGKSGWWFLLFYLAERMGSFFQPGSATIETPVQFFGFLLEVSAVLWIVIELGILRGQDGVNRYGPDPRVLAAA